MSGVELCVAEVGAACESLEEGDVFAHYGGDCVVESLAVGGVELHAYG